MKQWKCDNSRDFYSVFTFILEHHFQSQISLRNANTCLGNIKIWLHKSIYNNLKYNQCKNKTKQKKQILFLFVWTKPIEKCPLHTCLIVIIINITKFWCAFKANMSLCQSPGSCGPYRWKARAKDKFQKALLTYQAPKTSMCQCLIEHFCLSTDLHFPSLQWKLYCSNA